MQYIVNQQSLAASRSPKRFGRRLTPCWTNRGRCDARYWIRWPMHFYENRERQQERYASIPWAHYCLMRIRKSATAKTEFLGSVFNREINVSKFEFNAAWSFARLETSMRRIFTSLFLSIVWHGDIIHDNNGQILVSAGWRSNWKSQEQL